MSDDAISAGRAGGAPSVPGGAAIGPRELDALKARRTTAGLPLPTEAEPADWLGIGLSGGGIRSATFCLGFFQALARERLVGHVDLLSTVSGGGYFGAFLGRLFRRDFVSGVSDVEDVLRATRNPEVVHHLRENGRYLAPGGSGDYWIAVATILRAWVAVVGLLGLLLLLPFLSLHFIRLVLGQVHDGWGSFGLDAVGLRSTGEIWWSPWLVLPAGLILFGALPIGSGYWLADRERRLKVIHLGTVAGIAIAFACLPHAARWLGVPVAIIALEAMLMIPRTKAVTDGALAALRTRRTRTLAILLQASAGLLALSAADTLAGSLYRSAAGGAFWGRIAAVIGAAAGVLAAYGDRVAAVLKPVAGRIRLSVPRSLLFATAGIGLAACLLVGVGIFSHALSAGLDVPSDRPVPVDASGTPSTASREHRDLIWTTGSLAACMFLSWLASLSTPFLNRSSHHAFYAARLTRSYLGASNPRRHGRGLALREYDADDDTELEAYYDTAGFQGAPVHLVNLTINETVDGASNVQQRDRRGLILSIGPDGARVGRDRAVDIDWKQGAVLVDSGPRTGNQLAGGARPEALTLGQWTALSGAAFSTGLGSRTHLGTSLLCGIGNIRLGYWWSPGFPPGVSVGEVFEAGWRRIRAIGSAVASTVSFVVRRVTSGVSGLRALGTPSKPPVRPPSEPLAVIPGLRRGPRILTRLREIFGVHAYILSEFVARFPGTSWPRWYLSDGGHFENLGGYELVRRRLPRILLVDAEADPTYVFEGLSNLVRKARMDFGAEIRFLNEHELDAEVAPDVRPFFGSLSALRRRPSKAPDRTGGLRRTSVARAALAEVTYDDRSRGRLLYVKATVTGDEPIDVVAYAMAHASFPHESTLDQSFDEAQWESYRRLGEHVGSLLFADGGHTGTHGFHPRTFFRGAATAPTPPTSPDRRATPGTKSA